jgi:hypothetical protein
LLALAARHNAVSNAFFKLRTGGWVQTFAYILGGTLVGLGIVLLAIGTVVAIGSFSENEIITAIIVCGVALLSGCSLLVLGMRFVRFAENDRSGTESRIKTAQPKNNDTPHFAPDFSTRFATFDLSRLNLWGWLLFLSTIAFMGFEILIMVYAFEFYLKALGTKIVGVAALVLGLGYFALAKMMLNMLGIGIYRNKQNPNHG